MKAITRCVALGMLVSAPATIAGQSGPPAACTIQVTGDIPKPTTITSAQLQALPRQEIRMAGHGQDTASYSAVRLADVLGVAGVRLGPGPKGAGVAQYVVARAADGYRAVYAAAELDSAMTDRAIWLADGKNGNVLDKDEGPCRILAPSDRRHARSMRQVTALEFHQVR